MKRPLRRKLLYSYLTVTVIILVGVSLALSVLIREYFIASKNLELVKKGRELGRVVDSYNEGRISYDQFSRFINYVDDLLDARIWVVDAAKNIVVSSGPRRSKTDLGSLPGTEAVHARGSGSVTRALSAEFAPVFGGEVVTRSFYHPQFGESLMMVAVPLKNADDSVKGAIILISPVRGIDQFLLRIYFYIGGIGLLALLITFWVARYLAKGIVSPLTDMQASAAAMAQGNYNTRIEIKTEDEVGELGKSLNTLARELGKFVSNTTKMEKLRRDFVANISHELRTPLTVIRGYTEALLDGTIPKPEQAEKYHRLMRDETIRLEGLINELLDLSRLQSANNSLALEKLPLAAIAESVLAMLKQRAEQAEVTLAMEQTGESGEVLGNGDRLTQLLLIFVDNALKFTRAGGKVTIGVKKAGGKVVLTVQDNGVGIAQEDLQYIWERFYKADKSRTRSESGTGLGLAIAREIISLHRGEAEVISRLGEGTTFKIYFPGVVDSDA